MKEGGGWLGAREEELACSPEEREGKNKSRRGDSEGKEKDRDTVRRNKKEGRKGAGGREQ